MPAAAQDRNDLPDIPPPPGAAAGTDQSERRDADGPRTFAEESSPASLGAAVMARSDGKLVVTDLVPGSAAATAGLLDGDVVVSLDGNFITEADGFHEYFAAHPAQPVRLVVLRDGVERTIVLHEAPASSATTEVRPALGVRFVQGPQVVLAEVVSGSPADLAGLQPGDHVVAVDGEVIGSTDHFITLVAAAVYDASLELTYVRNQERRWAAIEPAAWDVVFGSTTTRVALKPAAPDSTVVAAPAVTYYTTPWYTTNVSPVVVPAAWYYPYYPAYAWYYYYWGYPYYAYYPAYYPYWYHAPHWPYARPHAVHPHTHGAPAATRTDSARSAPPASSSRPVADAPRDTNALEVVERR
jgi:membrane-associated protease RseP (regulator of RpoE activity)